MHSEDDRRSIPTDRRLVGVDLGIASDHTVRVLRGDGSEVCRRRTRPTVESLTLLETAALDRRVRACDRLTQQGALHQRRIKDLLRQLMPVTPLTGELSKTDLAALAHWADPRALLAAGRSRLLATITTTSHGQQGADRADAWLEGAQAAVDLYGEHPAVAYSDLAAEVGTEVRLLQAVRAELTGHAEARADAYRRPDPARLAASLPGLGEVGAPTVTAIVGRAARFRTGKGVPLLHRAGAPGQRNRRDQPQGPAHE